MSAPNQNSYSPNGRYGQDVQQGQYGQPVQQNQYGQYQLATGNRFARLQGALAGETNRLIDIRHQPFALVADIEFFKLQVVGGDYRISRNQRLWHDHRNRDIGAYRHVKLPAIAARTTDHKVHS